MENKIIEGSQTVSRHLIAGGNASVGGSLTVGHNLLVKGWVDAPNIKGPLKGLYASEAALKAAYPRPMPGWFALVGNTLPADVWRSEVTGRAGLSPSTRCEWMATGEKGGEFRVWLDDVQGRLDEHEETLANHDELIGDLQDCASEHGERLTTAEAGIRAHGEELKNHSAQISTLQQTAKEHGASIAGHEETLTNHDELIGDLQDCASEHGERLTTAEAGIRAHGEELKNHSTHISTLEQTTKEHGASIASHEETLANHDELIGDLQDCASEHGERLTTAEAGIKANGEELKAQEEELKYQRQMILNTNEGLGAAMTDLYGLFTQKTEEELEAMAAAGEMEEGKFYFSVEDDEEDEA